MMASSYDMTKVENFLIVEKLRQRCVDGLILTGLFDSKIIDNLRSLKIPIIFIGGNEQEGILCLRSNMHQTYLKMLDYLTENEHRKIFFASNLDYVRQVFKEAVDEFTITSPQLRTNFQYGENALNSNEFVNGRHYAEQWLKADKADRYTAFISNEQVCCGFLSEIIKNKVDCPGEISIFSNIDSFLCQANAIPISAPSSSLFERGKLAADLLIDLLEGQKTSKQIKKVLKQEYKTHELIIRSTTGKAPQNNN
jgi:DNA-binding LacI/PurR family transcriptional regulator